MNLESCLKNLLEMNPSKDRMVPDNTGLIRVIKSSQGGANRTSSEDLLNVALKIQEFVESHPDSFREKRDVYLFLEIETLFLAQSEWIGAVPKEIKALTRKIIDSTRYKIIIQNAILNSNGDKNLIVDNINMLKDDAKKFHKRIHVESIIDNVRSAFEKKKFVEFDITSDPHFDLVVKILLGGEKKTSALKEISSEKACEIIKILDKSFSFWFDKESQIHLFGKLKEEEVIGLFLEGINGKIHLLMSLLTNKIISQSVFLKILNNLKKEDALTFFKEAPIKDDFPFVSLYQRGLKKEWLYKGLSRLSQLEAFQILKTLDETFGMTKEYVESIEKNEGKSPIENYLPQGFKTSTLFEKMAGSIESYLPISLTDQKKIELWKGARVNLVTQKMVSKAFNERNYKAIQFILEHAEPEWMKMNAPLFLEHLLVLEDEKIGELCLKKVPDLRLFCPPHLFKRAVVYSHEWFIDWILKEKTLHFEDHFIKELIPIAIKNHNLKIIKSLSENYIELLNLEEIKNNKELLVEEITKYAIQSSLEEVYELLKTYPEIGEVLNEVLEQVALLVRFPNLLNPIELKEENREIEVYFKNTLTYAKENNEFVNKTVSKVSSLTHQEFLSLVIKDRCDRLSRLDKIDESLIENYQRKLIETQGFNTSFTPLTDQAGLPSRYSHSLKHLAAYAYDFESEEWRSKTVYPSIKITNQSVSFHYKTENFSMIEVPTTLLNQEGWTHTPKGSVNYLENERQELHQEIFNFPLDPLDPTSMKLFFAKVARGYWLMATLCEVLRGTPHNAMIWLNEVYRHHNLPPPIPLREHFFLDNTMLMIPYERAIELWETFFEKTLDSVIDEALLKKILSINGLVLGLCSPKTRARKEMVEMAISQNKEASRFAL